MAAQASVSGPVEASPLSGLGLIEDGQDLNEAMESNSWVAESLAVFGTSMDVQQLVSDPLQTLMSWGISWLLDHMSPLKDWLNELTGNPGEVQGFAATWTSTGESLQTNSADLARSVTNDLEGQEGMGIAAYSALQTDIAKHVELAGTCSNAMSTALGVASTWFATRSPTSSRPLRRKPSNWPFPAAPWPPRLSRTSRLWPWNGRANSAGTSTIFCPRERGFRSSPTICRDCLRA